MIGDRDDVVVTDLRPRQLGACVGDQLGQGRPRLAQLELTLDGVKVRVALTQYAPVLGSVFERRPERGRRIGIDRVDLKAAPLARQA